MNISNMKSLLLLSVLIFVRGTASDPQITIENQCNYDIWIAQLANGGFSPLDGSGVGIAGHLSHDSTATYQIPSGGWGGRFWPKIGCDNEGNNCDAGSSMPPCPPDGCQPPAETKVEFFYYPLDDTQNTPYYDVSLVDGYSIPTKITPSETSGGSCIETACSMSIGNCPQDEIDGLGDLRVNHNGKYTMCLSPCKKWNYPPPYGKGQPENIQPGLDMCCPTPPVNPDDCRNGDIVRTNYVKLVQSECPSAYSYSYDDHAGLHSCPPGTSFHVTFCY